MVELEKLTKEVNLVLLKIKIVVKLIIVCLNLFLETVKIRDIHVQIILLISIGSMIIFVVLILNGLTFSLVVILIAIFKYMSSYD